MSFAHGDLCRGRRVRQTMRHAPIPRGAAAVRVPKPRSRSETHHLPTFRMRDAERRKRNGELIHRPPEAAIHWVGMNTPASDTRFSPSGDAPVLGAPPWHPCETGKPTTPQSNGEERAVISAMPAQQRTPHGECGSRASCTAAGNGNSPSPTRYPCRQTDLSFGKKRLFGKSDPRAHVRNDGCRRRSLALDDGTCFERLQLIAVIVFRKN